MSVELFPRLASTVREAQGAFASIPEERRSRLQEIARFVERKRESGEIARLTFICTHNSRRSHMAQIWAHTAAAVCDISGVESFSGGSEATAFDARAVAALRKAGFEIAVSEEGENPVYVVQVGPEFPAIEAFSKSYESAPNPTQDFCAVMTCADADANCPIVHGASARVSIPYEDPKAYDGTELEAQKYDERCAQIGTEMLYVFSLLGGYGGR